MKCFLLFLFALQATEVYAQTPPSPLEVENYGGLHAVAVSGSGFELGTYLHDDIEARDAYGRTPVHVATFMANRPVIKKLAEAGADLNALENDQYDAVTIASVAGDEVTLALLLTLGASAKQITSPYEGTALIAAAHLGHYEICRLLIEAGAPLNHINNLHWTALIEAVVLGDGGPRHQSTVKVLLDAGADTRLTDRQGNTALDLAAKMNAGNLVELLEASEN